MVIDGILITHVTELTAQAFELLIGLQDLLQCMVEEANETKPNGDHDQTGGKA